LKYHVSRLYRPPKRTISCDDGHTEIYVASGIRVLMQAQRHLLGNRGGLIGGRMLQIMYPIVNGVFWSRFLRGASRLQRPRSDFENSGRKYVKLYFSLARRYSVSVPFKQSLQP